MIKRGDNGHSQMTVPCATHEVDARTYKERYVPMTDRSEDFIVLLITEAQ